MINPALKQRIEKEIETAVAARAAGNEGRARVCARRAAGLAAQVYFLDRGIIPDTGNAFNLLIQLSHQSDLNAKLHLAATHLTLRVNEQFQLPAGVDLIAEARLIISAFGLSGQSVPQGEETHD